MHIPNDLKPLELGGFLTPSPAGSGLSFTRDYPENENFPAITVGLGFLYIQGMENVMLKRIASAPNQRMTSAPFINTFTSDIYDLYLKYSSQYPTTWPERVLINMGYVIVEGKDGNPNTSALFSEIPQNDRDALLDTYQLNDIATMVTMGFTKQMLPTLKKLYELTPVTGLKVSRQLELLALGVPVEDLLSADELPADMLYEFYGQI